MTMWGWGRFIAALAASGALWSTACAPAPARVDGRGIHWVYLSEARSVLGDMVEAGLKKRCLVAPADPLVHDGEEALLFRCRGESVVVMQSGRWLGFRCVARDGAACEELVQTLAPEQSDGPAVNMSGRGSG